MLHKETAEKHTLELLGSLMEKDYLNSFVLVGGTALALQIGHRKSIDLDLFTTEEFTTDDLAPELARDYDLQITTQTNHALICTINDVKVDFILFKYPFISEISVLMSASLLSR